MQMTGAQILIETLVAEDATAVFGYPGGFVLNIYDELYKNSDRITHFITCHEQGACHAADGYARATGRVGVAIATSGPGATNLVTGIATAHLDSTPLVAITGNVPSTSIGRDGFQEVDITGITLPITKHNYIVKDVRKLAGVIREAFKIAKSGRPGPVLVDIPKDVQLALCEYEPAAPDEAPEAPTFKQEDFDRAVKLIRESQRPFLYAGGGVVISDASEELIELSKRLHAPIGSSIMGITAVPTFVIGDRTLSGVQPKEVLERAIDEAAGLAGVCSE